MKIHRILLTATSALLLALTGANAQYTPNFNDFTGGSSLSGQDSWDTNNANQPDYVGVIPSYSVSGSDYWAELGGLAGAPGQTQTQLWRNFTLTDPLSGDGNNATFSTKMSIASSQIPRTSRDSFQWVFAQAGDGNGTPGALLASINFTPGTRLISGNLTNVMDIGYTDSSGTYDSISHNALYYDSQYNLVATLKGLGVGNTPHLEVSFTPVLGPDPMMTVINTNVSVTDQGTGIQSVAAAWDLTGTPSQYGFNSLIFQNYAVVVPEPSILALLGVAGLGLLYRRSGKRPEAV